MGGKKLEKHEFLDLIREHKALDKIVKLYLITSEPFDHDIGDIPVFSVHLIIDLLGEIQEKKAIDRDVSNWIEEDVEGLLDNRIKNTLRNTPFSRDDAFYLIDELDSCIINISKDYPHLLSDKNLVRSYRKFYDPLFNKSPKTILDALSMKIEEEKITKIKTIKIEVLKFYNEIYNLEIPGFGSLSQREE